MNENGSASPSPVAMSPGTSQPRASRLRTSEQISSIAGALSKAQAEFPGVEFDATNPFLKNKYASLGALIKSTRPALAKNGLSVIQVPYHRDANSMGVETRILHESGEWMAGDLWLEMSEEKGKSWAQVMGSVITYLRRYAYSSMLCLYGEEDTDGNNLSNSAPPPSPASRQNNQSQQTRQPQQQTQQQEPKYERVNLAAYDNKGLVDLIQWVRENEPNNPQLAEMRQEYEKRKADAERAKQEANQAPQARASTESRPQFHPAELAEMFKHVVGTPEYTRFLDTVQARGLKWATEADVSDFENAMTDKTGNIYVAREMRANDFGEVTVLIANEDLTW